VSGASPTLRSLIVQGNTATSSGAGLAVINGSPVIDDNVFSGNVAGLRSEGVDAAEHDVLDGRGVDAGALE
jgi:hypothetical protein